MAKLDKTSSKSSRKKSTLSEALRKRAWEKKAYFHDTKVPGLMLRKKGDYYQWIYRRNIKAERKEVGLGGLKKVTLEQARDKARSLISLSDGEFRRKTNKQQEVQEEQPDKSEATFRDAAREFEKDMISLRWKEFSKTHRVYQSRMKNHILPFIGDRFYDRVTYADVAAIAKPIWDKVDTVNRCLAYIRRIYIWGKAKGYPDPQYNPAIKTGPLEALLPQEKHKTQNRGALSVEDLPPFMRTLHEAVIGGNSSAFECAFFAILTTTRSFTARSARWEHINFKEQTWDIPAELLKTKNRGGLTVFLAPQVMDFLLYIKAKRETQKIDSELIFPNRDGNIMSDTMVSSVVRRLEGNWIDEGQSEDNAPVRATIHGIARATFRTFSQYDVLDNDKKYSAQAAELCLHHKLDDKYKGAYDRNTMNIRRKELLYGWAEYCYSQITIPEK